MSASWSAQPASLPTKPPTRALNRGILMTPFHNMALITAEASEADVDHHTQVFREAVTALFG